MSSSVSFLNYEIKFLESVFDEIVLSRRHFCSYIFKKNWSKCVFVPNLKTRGPTFSERSRLSTGRTKQEGAGKKVKLENSKQWPTNAWRCYDGDATMAMLRWRRVLLYEANSSWALKKVPPPPPKINYRQKLEEVHVEFW